jgi:hypothetical protein
MRGHLYKKVMPNTWYVAYTADDFGFHKTELPLHPDDVKFLEDCNLVFDNLEARVAVNPDVEFEIVVHEETSKHYAKLISSKEQQKQLITEIMELDAKDGLYDTVNDTVNELDKLAEETFKGDDATTFVQREIWKDGYRKAKETLYTEEQVREAINMCHQYIFGYNLIESKIIEIIKSLKQPKKD